jgi:hypothetical protein
MPTSPSDTVLPPARNVTLAKSAAVKALASDDSLAEVQTAVGRVLQHCDWDWAGAERAFKRANSNWDSAQCPRRTTMYFAFT